MKKSSKNGFGRLLYLFGRLFRAQCKKMCSFAPEKKACRKINTLFIYYE